jgi:hypothetical protein
LRDEQGIKIKGRDNEQAARDAWHRLALQVKAGAVPVAAPADWSDVFRDRAARGSRGKAQLGRRLAVFSDLVPVPGNPAQWGRDVGIGQV